MTILRRVVGVSLFDREICREILYDPRAIYQALLVLAVFLLFGTTWDLATAAFSLGPLLAPGGVEAAPDPGSIGVGVGLSLVTVALSAAEIAIIMTLGRWVMRADAAPSWRGFISLWGFAQTPWIVGGILSAGLVLVSVGIPSGRGAEMIGLALLVATLVWGVSVKVHMVRHAFDSESVWRASLLVIGIWVLQSALGLAW